MLSHGGIILLETCVAHRAAAVASISTGDPTLLNDPRRQTRWLASRAASHGPTGACRRSGAELGLMDPEGPGSFTHLHLSRMLHADGKVVFTRAGSGRSGSTRRPGRLSR